VHAFAHLPRSLLALRIAKIEEEGPKSPKRVKGQWNIKVEPQQEIRDDLYYAWFYEPKTWTQTLSSVGLVIALFTIVLFPLWPPMLRLGVWYLSMGMLGLIGLFMIMSVFRLILFLVTMVALSPGIWLYPNLFEDVGFFDSFRPLWAWHKVCSQWDDEAPVVFAND
jgi:translocation protein SEC62